MNTITKLVNNETHAVIVLDTTASKAEQYRTATVAGMDMGKSSFMRLVDGKVEHACGWVKVVEQETVGHIAEDVLGKLNQIKDILAAKGYSTVVKQSATETYGTVVVEEGRIQFNPVKKGLSLMFYPKKGMEPKDIAKKGFKVEIEKSQYARLEQMEVNSFLAHF